MPGSLAQAASIGSLPLNMLFSGRQERDIEQMRNLSLQDAIEMLKQRQLETPVKQYEASMATAKNTPEYIQDQLDTQRSQNLLTKLSAERQTKTQQSDIEARLAENFSKIEDSKWDTLISGFDNAIGILDSTRGNPDQQAYAAEHILEQYPEASKFGFTIENLAQPGAQEKVQAVRDKLIDLRSRNPKTVAAERMAGIKGDQAMMLAELKNASAEKIAAVKKQAKGGDKNAQQALVRFWNEKLEKQEINQQQWADEVSSIFSAANAPKVQPGVTLDPKTHGLVPKDTSGSSYKPSNVQPTDRKQILTQELQRVMDELKTTPESSPRYQELVRNAQELDRELKKVGGGTVTSGQQQNKVIKYDSKGNRIQ